MNVTAMLLKEIFLAKFRCKDGLSAFLLFGYQTELLIFLKVLKTRVTFTGISL